MLHVCVSGKDIHGRGRDEQESRKSKQGEKAVEKR